MSRKGSSALAADHAREELPEGATYTMRHVFTIEAGEARLPEPPITGNAG